MPIINGIYHTIYEGGNEDFPTIILIHGAGGNRLAWPGNIRRLQGYQVITLDLPGHGRSEEIIGEHSIDTYALRVVDFLDALNLYHSVLIGHSMGAAIAMTVAINYPELVGGLGIISGSSHFSIASEFLEILSPQRIVPNSIDYFTKHGFSQSTPRNIIELSNKMLKDIRPGVLYGDWLACAGFDKTKELFRIIIPTWVCVGIDDQMTPLTCSHFLVSQIPNTKLQMVGKAGHMVIIEQPEEVEKGILNFFGKITLDKQHDGLRTSQPGSGNLQSFQIF